jgi:hypothetical protein
VPAAAPRAEPDGAPVSVDLETLQRRWNVLVEELKRRPQGRSTSALVAEAQPVRLEGSTLVLGFQYETHVHLLERPEDRKRLEDTVADLFGTRLRVVGEVLGEAPVAAPVAAPPALPRSAPSARRPEGNGDGAAPVDNSRLIHEVIEIFDGKIIDDEPI